MSKRRSVARTYRVPVPRGRLPVVQQPTAVPSAGLVCGILLVITILVLYVRTAARDIVVGDTPELMTVAITLGVAHPPGYPLLTFVGHLFSLLPLGPVGFRLSLMATVCGAAAVGLVYLTAWRLSGSWPAAALAALALALDPLIWSWSIVFEAFSLNNLMASALVCLLVCWRFSPDKGVRYLIAAAFIGGLGLCNHQTLVLLAPATLFLICTERQLLTQRPQILLICGAAVAVGLLPYLYIPWAASRRPYLSWGDVTSLRDFLAVVLRADYGTAKLVAASEFAGGSPVTRLAALAASFSPFAAGLLIAGAVDAYRLVRWYFWFVLIATLVTGPVFVAYANMDLSKEEGTRWVLERFFLLSHVVAAPLGAFGAMLLARTAAAALSRVPGRPVHAALAAGALIALVAPALMAYREIDQSDNHLAGNYARDVLDTLEEGSVLLATGDEHGPPIAYLQAVVGKRPDVTLVFQTLIPGAWYIRHLKARNPTLHVPSKPAVPMTLRDLVDANQERPIAMVGPPVDKSLEGAYGYIRNGLVSRVLAVNRVLDLTHVAVDNDVLLQRYHPPSPATIKSQTFEPQLLRSYAAPAEWIAAQYQQAGRHSEAARWYQRALSVDPAYPEAKEGLAQVTGR